MKRWQITMKTLLRDGAEQGGTVPVDANDPVSALDAISDQQAQAFFGMPPPNPERIRSMTIHVEEVV